MGTCYYYRGMPTQLAVLSNPDSDLSASTLVYMDANGRKGFDEDDVGRQCLRQLVNGALYFEKETGQLHRYPSDVDSLVRAIRLNCTAALIGKPEILSRYISESEEYMKQRKIHAMRMRFGKSSTAPIAPKIYEVYDGNRDLLNVKVMTFAEFEFAIAIKWKWSDFGLHAYVISDSAYVIQRVIQDFGQIPHVKLVECESELEIPVT